jgi:hypothetical protein
MGGAHWEVRNVQNLTGKSEGKRPLAKPRSRWKDKKIDLK